MIAAVTEMALSLAGAQEDDSVLLALVEVAVAELEGRLKGGVAPEDCKTAFVLAAALFALEALEQVTGSSGGTTGEISSFSVGDFSVSQSGGSSVTTGGQSYRSCGEQLMKPYVLLTDFAFSSVQG